MSDGEADVVDYEKITQRICTFKKQMVGYPKGLDQKQWQM